MRTNRLRRDAAARWSVLVLWGLLAGCATGRAGIPLGGVREFEALRYRPATPEPMPDTAARQREQSQPRPVLAGGGGPAGMVVRSVMGGLRQLDAFEAVLVLAGLDNPEALPPPEAPLTPEDAAALYDELLDKLVSLAQFGPRLVASYLLREAMEGEEELPREVLLQRVQRFRGLVVLRPDGYLAWALTGQTQQHVAEVEWKDGAFRAHAFEVGHFYSGRNAMAFFAVDEHLRDNKASGVLTEVYDDAGMWRRRRLRTPSGSCWRERGSRGSRLFTLQRCSRKPSWRIRVTSGPTGALVRNQLRNALAASRLWSSC